VAKTKVICDKFLLNVDCQKLSKLANVSWSYSKNKSGTFLWTTVYKQTCDRPDPFTYLTTVRMIRKISIFLADFCYVE